jgi:hypothetical protein
MRINLKLHKFIFNKGGWTKKLEEQGFVLMREAMREWVRAVIVKIPVWSGMARGSVKFAKGRAGPGTGVFLHQFLRVTIPINPVANSWRWNKNPEAGGKQARWTLTFSKNQYRFTYNNDVVHFLINEFFDGPPPSFTRPWHSMEAGRTAMINYIAANKNKMLPKIKDFTTTTTVTVK